jgi:hypothetical protein
VGANVNREVFVTVARHADRAGRDGLLGRLIEQMRTGTWEYRILRSRLK